MEKNCPAAEVISIGDEMTSGARLDTNSQWLSQELSKLGFRVLFHTTVGDSMDACLDTFKHAMQRVQLIVITGGLGPTADDLTRQAIASATQRPLQFDPESMQHIEGIFARRGRDMPPQNRIQAMFPEGCLVIPNPNGTAPGIDLTLVQPSCRIIALPGVPAEMQEMWNASVAPALNPEGQSRVVIRNAVIKCFGLGESEMESRLGGMIARERSPRVGITVSRATISLRIEAIAPTQEDAMQQIESTRQEILSRVGPFVFGEGESFELEHAITNLLRERGQTLATIEYGGDSVLSGTFARANASDVVTHCVNFPTIPDSEPNIRSARTQKLAELSRLNHGSSGPKIGWILEISGYPHLQPSHDPSSRSARLTSPPNAQFTISQIQPPAEDELDSCCAIKILHHSEEAIGGHWEIIASRIAKTGMQKLLHYLQSIT